MLKWSQDPERMAKLEIQTSISRWPSSKSISLQRRLGFRAPTDRESLARSPESVDTRVRNHISDANLELSRSPPRTFLPSSSLLFRRHPNLLSWTIRSRACSRIGHPIAMSTAPSTLRSRFLPHHLRATAKSVTRWRA